MEVARALVLCAAAAGTCFCARTASGENMVANAGFEDGATGWRLPAPLFSIDGTVAHTGASSLRYQNEPRGPYLIAGQGLNLQPGKCYRMRVWVKTEGIVSTDTGAAISLEWSGKQGYIGGAYPPGCTGTADWQQIVFESGIVPEGVTDGSVILYGRESTSGTAWFDDVEVTELEEPLVRWRFAGLPRGERCKTVLAGLASPEVRLRAELSAARGVRPQGLVLSARLHRGGQTTEIVGGAWDGTTGEIAVPTDDLPFGETLTELRLVAEADNRPLTSEFVRIVKRPLMRMDIVGPNPAGMLGFEPERDRLITVRISVAPQGGGQAQRYRARLSFLSHGRPTGGIAEATVSDTRPGQARITTEGLGEGLHQLRCELFAEGGTEPIARGEAVVTRGDPGERPANATLIGPHRMLIVDGQPFFPIGFYILSSFESVFPADQPYRWQTGDLQPSYYLPILDRLSRSHFNCIIDYGSTLGGMDAARDLMDAAHQRGIRTIFSVKDLMRGAFWEVYTQNLPWHDLREANRNVVRELRDHPSLIAWYVNDEVCQPDVWPGAVDVFRDTRATDPWHPTYAVHYDYQGLAKYREACDIIGTDPYTLLGDIGFTARSWRECRQQMPPEQPFWAVVQCFGAGYESSRPTDTREPTYDEQRAATFAAIAEGATGIIYYCFHSLQRSPRFEQRFEELDRIAAEVQELVPIIAPRRLSWT